jgi:hypothetical protein
MKKGYQLSEDSEYPFSPERVIYSHFLAVVLFYMILVFI